MDVLSRRALNRTLLHRQFLLERTALAPASVIERLVAMQAQEPNWPYVGLWSRIAGFQGEDLTRLLEERKAVRGTLLRNTQHLLMAADYRWMRPLLQPVLDRGPRQGFARDIEGLDLEELAGAARELLRGNRLTRADLGQMLAERFPGRNGAGLAGVVQFLLPLLHPPPNSTWGAWGHRARTPYLLAEEWLGAPLLSEPGIEELVRRYLAAFGPATAADVQAWSGLTGIRPVLARMRGELRTFRDEAGRELFDLPGATVLDPDVPAPVRFVAGYDNLLLAYEDRSRILSDEDRRTISATQRVIPATFLVDGFVAGMWRIEAGNVVLTPFRALSTGERAAIEAEGELLLAFLGESAAGGDLVFGPPPG